MKTTCFFAVISLALFVSATAQNGHHQDNNNNRFGKGNGRSHNAGGSNSTSTAAGGASSATLTPTATEDTSSAAPTSTATGDANSTATGVKAVAGGSDPQSSLTLVNQVIATGFENNGQNVPTAGQVASLTSPNNFINFCLTVPNLPITNGKQIATGSCNPAPMGIIPSNNNMPSAKFVFPKNGDTSLVENAQFTIQMAIQNFQSGAFVNAEENYFAAPQQLNANGQIIGHSHVVVEALSALDQTQPTEPLKFAFFKGLNDAAVNGVLTAVVTSGLPAGFYKLSSINTAANHQPVLVPVAQHGSLDDAVYFTVNSKNAAAAPVASTSAAAVASASASAPAQPTKGKQGKRVHRALN